MLDRRFLMVLGVSVLLASLVSGVFYRVVASARARPRTEFKDAVVATQPLPTGALIRPHMVKLARIPAGSCPKGAFSRVEDVAGRAVSSGILEEEPVVEGRLAAPGGGFGLSPLIPEGMRAVSVRVNDVVGVAGFALPGMRVDVLATGRPPGRTDSLTSTVLQDIAVLSAGQSIQADPKGSAMAAQVVTLLVDPREAETLTLANSEGHIHLVLRNAADRGRSQTPGRTLGDLYRVAPARPEPAGAVPAPRPRLARAAAAGAAPPRAEPPPVPAAAPAPDRMVILHGTKVTVQTFEKERTS